MSQCVEFPPAAVASASIAYASASRSAPAAILTTLEGSVPRAPCHFHSAIIGKVSPSTKKGLKDWRNSYGKGVATLSLPNCAMVLPPCS